MQRGYQNNWLKARRLTWLAKNGPCVQCGSWKDLQVDHKDPEQKVTHRIWSWARERREKELAQCQPLCKGCHWEKTKEQSFGELLHGSWKGYRRGCHCSACKTGYAIRRRIDKTGAYLKAVRPDATAGY